MEGLFSTFGKCEWEVIENYLKVKINFVENKFDLSDLILLMKEKEIDAETVRGDDN